MVFDVHTRLIQQKPDKKIEKEQHHYNENDEAEGYFIKREEFQKVRADIKETEENSSNS